MFCLLTACGGGKRSRRIESISITYHNLPDRTEPWSPCAFIGKFPSWLGMEWEEEEIQLVAVEPGYYCNKSDGARSLRYEFHQRKGLAWAITLLWCVTFFVGAMPVSAIVYLFCCGGGGSQCPKGHINHRSCTTLCDLAANQWNLLWCNMNNVGIIERNCKRRCQLIGFNDTFCHSKLRNFLINPFYNGNNKVICSY